MAQSALLWKGRRYDEDSTAVQKFHCPPLFVLFSLKKLFSVSIGEKEREREREKEREYSRVVYMAWEKGFRSRGQLHSPDSAILGFQRQIFRHLCVWAS